MVDLRDQVSTLNSRISELDNVVAYLLNNLPQNTNSSSVCFSSLPAPLSSSIETDPNSNATEVPMSMMTQPSLEHDDKKRKLKLETNVVQQQSAFNSYPIQSFPSAPITQSSYTNYDVFNSSTTAYVPSNYSPISSQQSNYRNYSNGYLDEDEEMVPGFDGTDDVFFEALLAATTNDNDDDYIPIETETPVVNVAAAHNNDDISYLVSHTSETSEKTHDMFDNCHNTVTTASESPSTTASSDYEPTRVIDNVKSNQQFDLDLISEVFRRLPTTEMQGRFVDQLATAIGQQVMSGAVDKPVSKDGPSGISDDIFQKVSDEYDRRTRQQASSMNNGEGDLTCKQMGVSALEEQCPLIALGAYLASVRLSTTEAAETAVQTFSKSCVNFKDKIKSKLYVRLSSSTSGRTLTAGDEEKSRLL